MEKSFGIYTYKIRREGGSYQSIGSVMLMAEEKKAEDWNLVVKSAIGDYIHVPCPRGRGVLLPASLGPAVEVQQYGATI